MDTFQIAAPVLETYKNVKLSDERIDFLIAQANEQLEEISQKKEIYEGFLNKIKAPEKMDNIVRWILIMSNEGVCEDYSSEFSKGFRDIIPVSDLADLLFHCVFLNKVKGVELEGFDYLLEYESEGMEEIDQYSVINVLAYIQTTKEVQIQF